jgi:hypothetical protein
MSQLICPRCEKPLDGHDDGGCARRMSRRFFFGVVGGGILAAQAAPLAEPRTVLTATAGDWTLNEWVFTVGPMAHPQGLPAEFRLIYEATLEAIRLAPNPPTIGVWQWKGEGKIKG